jgi:hypothetical protein
MLSEALLLKCETALQRIREAEGRSLESLNGKSALRATDVIPVYQKEVEMCLLGNHELPDGQAYPLFHGYLADLKAKYAAHEEAALKKQKIEKKRQELQDEKMKLERLQSNVSQGNARLEEMQKEMTALKSELSAP